MGLYKSLGVALKQGIEHVNGKIERVKRIYRYDDVVNCPSPPLDTPMQTIRFGGGVVSTSVPYFRCVVCKHHIEPARELKYPCCGLLRQARRVKGGSLQNT